jgi:predicted Zn-dependent protease
LAESAKQKLICRETLGETNLLAFPGFTVAVLFFPGFHDQAGHEFGRRCADPYNTKAQMNEQKKTRREMLEEYVDKKPDDAFSRYGLAMECVNGGDSAAADMHFRTLIENNPDYVPAYLMYAQLLVRESRVGEAKQVLSSGISAAAQKGNQHAQAEMETLLADLG